MHASAITTTLLAGLSLGAMATPISNEANIARRSNSCMTEPPLAAIMSWSIYLDNDTYYNKHCGNGCLDNFRKQCGQIDNWECGYESPNRAHMTFTSVVGCRTDQISQALKDCTKGEQTINCVLVPEV